MSLTSFLQRIKQWFNNRCRGSDSGKGGRGELKLDIGEKRKLAAVQAYCTYAWDSLRPIVLTRWDQQKKSDTFDDDEDPPEPDVRGTPTGKLIAALAIEGAIFRVTKGFVDHQARSGFAGATGRWPGKDPAKEDD